jgi:ABC-type Fe3+/spermidine/putrescine transport system ATPase subunit
MLELRDIYMNYEGQPLLKGVSLDAHEGETVCLLGASGSGKSTLLRIIAGLEEPDSGEVLWDGQDIRPMPVHRRNFGLMFQDYALFPNRSVAGNVAFGLRMQGLPAGEVRERVTLALRQVNMEAFAARRVTDLSGGEQQRVALARSLAPNPRLLMLDEPLGALDRSLREQLTAELRSLLRAAGIAAIYVTHDQEEAFSLADRLVLLNNGVVAQAGVPAEVYGNPANTWVARFLGMDNLLPAVVVGLHPLALQTAAGVFVSSCSSENRKMGEAVAALFRPGGASLADDTDSAGNCLSGRVKDVVFRGEDYHVELACAGDALFRFNLLQPPAAGQAVSLRLSPSAVVCLPGGQGGMTG